MRSRPLVLAVLGLGAFASPATAATLTVTSSADVLSAGDNACTLREALRAAETDTASGGVRGECPAGSGADTVVLPAGRYVLAIPPSATALDGRTGSLLLDDATTLTGAGARTTTIDANGIDRVLEVSGAGDALRGVTLTGGLAPKGADAVFAGDPGQPGGAGGGVFVADGASLTVADSAIAGNKAGQGGAGAAGLSGTAGPGQTGGAGGRGGAGGGIGAEGGLVLQRTLITGNRAGAGGAGAAGGPGGCSAPGPGCTPTLGQPGRGGDGGSGGGLAALGGGVTATDTTITADAAGAHGAPGGPGAAGASGTGIEVVATAGSLALTQVTLVPPGPGPALALVKPGTATPTAVATASILSGSCPQDLGTSLTDGGGNVRTDASCPGLTGALGLSSLTDHGGPTDTLLPATGSAAIDAAGATCSSPADQRGALRPSGAACDAGAVERTTPLVTGPAFDGSASLTAVVDPRGFAGRVSVALAGGPGSATSIDVAGGPQAITLPLTGLTEGTSYTATITLATLDGTSAAPVSFTTPTTPPPPPPPPRPAPTSPVSAVKLRDTKLEALVRRKLRVRLTTTAACRVSIRAIAGRRDARALRLGRKRVAATGTFVAKAAGSGTVSLKPSKAVARRLVGRTAKLKLTLRLTIVDATGNPFAQTIRTTLKR